jgi:acetyltransferase-like isoleucine patch superfamily enzyme
MPASRILKMINRALIYLQYKADRKRLDSLIRRGLKVGKNVYIFQDVEFDSGYPFLIEIGDNCRISKGVLILAHDATTFRELGVTRLGAVRILEGSFIGQRAIILPGVTIGPRALVAAGSVVNRDVGEGKAVAGNPARPYSNYSDMIDKYRGQAVSKPAFSIQDMEAGNVGPGMISDCLTREKIAFVSDVPWIDPYYVNADMEQIRRAAKAAYVNLSASPAQTVDEEPNKAFEE